MRIVTWNLAGRVKRRPEQVKLLLALDIDVLCLQELTPSTLAPWQEQLQSAGYHTLASQAEGERTRPLHVLTAARQPLEGVAGRERALARARARSTSAGGLRSRQCPFAHES